MRQKHAMSKTIKINNIPLIEELSDQAATAISGGTEIQVFQVSDQICISPFDVEVDTNQEGDIVSITYCLNTLGLVPTSH